MAIGVGTSFLFYLLVSLIVCLCVLCTFIFNVYKFVYDFITARCTLVQSAVLRSHVVCPSVRPSVCDVDGL